MDYKRPLAYPIWPKSGPLPPMDMLRGANIAVANYLPRELLRRRTGLPLAMLCLRPAPSHRRHI